MRRAPVLLSLVLLGCLAGCGGDPASPGVDGPADGQADVVQARPGQISGDPSFVQLPDGRLHFEISAPRDELGADETADGEPRTPEDGRAFVGVLWQFKPGEGVPAWEGPLVTGDSPQIAVSLETGGTSYSLGVARRSDETPSDERSGSDFYLPVTGSGQDVTLSVDLDGVSQSVDARTGDREPGAAAALYEPPKRSETKDCSSGSWVRRGQADVKCSWWRADLPYVAGLGWASGAPWTVISLGTRLATYDVGGGTYTPGTLTDSTTLDGARPQATLQPTSSDGYLFGLLVFAGAGKTLSVGRTAQTSLATGDGPDTRTVSLAHAIPLG